MGGGREGAFPAGGVWNIWRGGGGRGGARRSWGAALRPDGPALPAAASYAATTRGPAACRAGQAAGGQTHGVGAGAGRGEG